MKATEAQIKQAYRALGQTGLTEEAKTDLLQSLRQRMDEPVSSVQSQTVWRRPAWKARGKSLVAGGAGIAIAVGATYFTTQYAHKHAHASKVIMAHTPPAQVLSPPTPSSTQGPSQGPTQVPSQGPPPTPDQQMFASLRNKSVQLTPDATVWAWGYDYSALGRFTLVHSGDAGQTWSVVAYQHMPVQPPAYEMGMRSANDQVQASFLSADAGWIGWVDGGTLHVTWTTDAGRTFAAAHVSLPKGTWQLQNLTFVDATNGYAVVTDTPPDTNANATTPTDPGEAKTLLHTSDGGRHWQAIASTATGQFKQAGHVTGLSMWIDGEGWLTTSNLQHTSSVLYHTTDGGHTWQIVAIPASPNKPTGVATGDYVVPKETGSPKATLLVGFAFPATGAPVIDQTVNGGQSWSTRVMTAIPDVTFSFDGTPVVDFVTQKLGYAVRQNQLYRTEDAGLTWQVVSPSNMQAAAQGYVGPVARISFLTQNFGYAVVEGNDLESRILFTKDGGHTWQVN